jgi:hypothetical protein
MYPKIDNHLSCIKSAYWLIWILAEHPEFYMDMHSKFGKFNEKHSKYFKGNEDRSRKASYANYLTKSSDS